MEKIFFTVVEIVLIIGFLYPIITRRIIPLVIKVIYKVAENVEDKCDVCKGNMLNTRRDLFLIPAQIDERHEESAAYYLRNATPLESSEQIPTGNRACYMFILQCQQCGRREVVVQDFLRVRGKEYIKGGDVYSYEELRELLER